MADMSALALWESLPNRIFSLSLRRRTESSSLGPASLRHGSNAESSSLGWTHWQTANPPPSPVCHHFRRAPSSDGALFFALRAPACHAIAHGTPAVSAFVGLGTSPHNHAEIQRHPSSSAASHCRQLRRAASKAPLIPSSGAFSFSAGQLIPAQKSWMRPTASSSSRFDAA